MAQQHLDPTDSGAGAAAGDALAGYLRAQATEFLRALRLHRETGAGGGGAGRAESRPGGNGSAESVDAARALRRSARRISASLHTFRPLLDTDWSEAIRPELAWVSGTLAMEHAYAARLERLLLALHRLSGATVLPAQPDVTGMAGAPGPAGVAGVAGVPGAAAGSGSATATDRTGAPASGPAAAAGRAAGSRTAATAPVPQKAAASHAGPPAPAVVPDRGNLTVGAAKAGALLERQLTLARTRAHSTALQALGSSRFHAVADNIAVLASEVPLTPAAATADLCPLAAAAEERLTDAVAALPLVTAGHPYNAEALVHGLSPDRTPHPQDAPWHQVRLLLRLHRYAREVLHDDGGDDDGDSGGDGGGGDGGGGDGGGGDGRGASPLARGPRELAAHPVDVRLQEAGHALNRHRAASEAAAAAAQAARTPRIAPATAYALGVLHADQRHEVEAARFAFQQSWQRETVGTP